MADANETKLATRTQPAQIGLSSTGALMPTNLAEAIEYAKMIAHSGMVPKQYDGNVGAVLVAVQMGAEIGLPPLASIQNIAVINGRPSLWGDAVLAVITAQPDCIDVQETEGEGWATCVVRRRGRTPITKTFTIADAKQANLWGKQGPWSQYPKRMLQMRARGFACRDAYPDRLRGISIAEEARDIPTGEIVDVSLEAGDHSFGFSSKAPALQAVPQAKETKTEHVPAAETARPLTAKEQAWREKQKQKREVAHNPKTGEVGEPGTISADDEYAHIGPPPMDDAPEPGSNG